MCAVRTPTTLPRVRTLKTMQTLKTLKRLPGLKRLKTVKKLKGPWQFWGMSIWKGLSTN